MEMIASGLLPEQLILGIPEVDVQHDSIFCRIENLKFLCLETNALCPSGMAGLLAYLDEHFRTEERIARMAGIDFAKHAGQHTKTLLVLSGWSQQVLSGRYDLFSFLRYLEVWFERHIREEDTPFARQVLAFGPADNTTG